MMIAKCTVNFEQGVISYSMLEVSGIIRYLMNCPVG